jgi:hypothetical protein
MLFHIERIGWPNVEPYWDTVEGFVVMAESADEARQLASQQKGDEGKAVWLNPKKSQVTLLDYTGDPRVILRAFHAG